MQTFTSTERGNRMQVVAQELIKCFTDRLTIIHSMADADENLAAARLALLPEGGWPGPNETVRKAAQLLAEDGDLDFNAAKQRRLDLDAEMAGLSLKIETLTTERRAHEQCLLEETLALNIHGWQDQHPEREYRP